MVLTNQKGTSLGPLTTTWSIPETCSLLMVYCSTCENAWMAQSCSTANGGAPRDNTECWPPARSGVASPTWPFNGWGFYSPGLACPSGYTTACTAVFGQRPDWDVQFNIYESETAVGCCPTGFACSNDNGNTCVVTATTTIAVQTAACLGTDIINSATRTFPDLITRTLASTATDFVSIQTSIRTMILFAPLYQLNFRAIDLPSKPTTTGAAKTSDTEASTTTSSETSQGGLSTGAKAGISVGVGIVVFGLLVVVAILFRRRWNARRPRAYGAQLATEDQNTQGGLVVKPATQHQAYEMPYTPAPVELPGDSYDRNGMR